jgi:hypothetical protein
MAATALVFQGPTALPVERSTETRLGIRGIRGTPEQMVKAGMEGFTQMMEDDGRYGSGF